MTDKVVEVAIEKKEEKSGKPSWMKMSQNELEKIVVELAGEGKTPAEIGLVLRDKHGVPKARLLGKKITEILKEKKIKYKKDKEIFEDKIQNLKKHIEKNKHDYPASRSLTKSLWRINKIERIRK